MELSELQREHDEWITSNFGGVDLLEAALVVAEEVGELCHHIVKMEQGIRGSREYHSEKIADAVGDIVIALAGVPTALNMDYGAAVQTAWDEVKQRDWTKHRGDGVSS